MPIQTVFLDAGGVLVNPNWSRVSEALADTASMSSPALLAAAEPRAKKRLDTGETIQATNDQQRGWTYFNLVLTEAGVPLADATAAALAELHAYHQTHNLWETVPDEVLPSLAALRAAGMRLVVLSNANGTLHRAFDRLGLTSSFDVIFSIGMSSTRSRSGRHNDRHDVQPVEQIVLEPPLVHELAQVAVGRRDHADVHLLGPFRAERLDFALLQDAQQLGLQPDAHRADLVEKDRAAVGQRELAFLGGRGSGERAPDVAEQLRFEQRFRNRRAVDLDERQRRAARCDGGRRGRPAPCRCRSRR